MAKQNLGMVTAYAYAVVGGYEGTEAEFEALLGNIATDLAEIENLTVIANTLPPGSQATASYDHGVLTLGIPKGDKGDTGAGATVTAGTTTTGNPGTNASVTNSGTTKDAVFNFTIPRGATGNGIESIYLTGTSGAVKTYTILFTDGNTTTFDVTDGEVTNAELTAVATELKEDLSKVSSITEQAVDLTTIVNTFIAINGTSQSGAYHTEIPVIKGEKYKIKSSDGSSVRAYVLLSNGSVVDYYATGDSWGTLHDYDIEYTIPQDGTLCVNSIDNLYIGVKKVNLVPLDKTSIDENTKGRTDALQLNKSKNLYNGEYIAGGYRSNRVIHADDEYCYSKPIFLKAGSYLYTTSYITFGGAGATIYIVDECGGIYSNSNVISTSSVGTVTEYGKYNNRRIDAFTLSTDSFVSFNIGRVSANVYADQVSNFMIVEGSTIDDFPHYEQFFNPFYSVKKQSINGLSGLLWKTAIFDGDSICRGDSVGTSDPSYNDGYAGRIGKSNYMTWKNYGIGGGTITSSSNPSIGSSRHSVVDNIDTMYAQFPDADFIVFEGGTNDADLLGDAIADPTKLGSYTDNDYSGTYDITTFSGALETIFYKAIQYWKGKKIGFVVAQKMGTGYSKFDKDHANRRAYFERAIEICNKWGVPCLNLWDGCYLNPRNASCYNPDLDADGNRSQGYLYIDGQHLTAKGYDYIAPIIENWMKSL